MRNIQTRLVCHVQDKKEFCATEVVCTQVYIMSDSDSLSPGVRIFMSEKEALWHEFEHGFSQQGSSSEGNPFADVPCGRILSQTRAGSSVRVTEEVDSDDADKVDSEETHVIAMTEAIEA